MSSDTSYFIDSFYVRLLGLDEGLVSPNKPKLIFLHGLLGNGQNWIPVARTFEKKFTILLMDQRGHGKSRPVLGGFHPRDFSKDLLKVVDSLKWEKFSIVAHSLGARVVFDFASRHSERIEKLVFEDMGPHKSGEASVKTERMILSVPVPFAERSDAKIFFEEKFKPKYGKVLSDYIYSNLSRQKNSEWDWRFNKKGILECLQVGRDFDFWTEFEAVKAKNLVVRGESSEHLPLEVYKEMLYKNSNSTGVEIAGAGHWVHFDQFGEFVAQVNKFLLE